MKKLNLAFLMAMSLLSLSAMAEEVNANAKPLDKQAKELCLKKHLAGKKLDDCIKEESAKHRSGAAGTEQSN